MRFAWHGLESCCCSSVSEPASKGLALWHGLESCCCSGVSEPASKGLAPKRQAFSHARPFAEMMSERRVIWLYLAREIVFYGFQSLAVFRYAFLLGVDSNPAAVRRLRRRFPKGICRDDVGATSDLAICLERMVICARILLLLACFATADKRLFLNWCLCCCNASRHTTVMLLRRCSCGGFLSRVMLVLGPLYFTYHRVVGHAWPFGVLCLHWIWPRVRAD